MDRSALEILDLRMMRRCLELSRLGTAEGEFPFAALICAPDATVLAEATNRVARDRDVTRHAELLAMSNAQKSLGRASLEGCTIYSMVEPCVMCSFPIRESRVARVVFAMHSPLMGGLSRWNVLGDETIAHRMPEYFSTAPEIVAGLLAHEAAKVWKDWSPEIWQIVRSRGCFEAGRSHPLSSAARPSG